MTFSFGQSERERIAVDVLRYERAVTGEFHDDNWLVVQIDVRAGGFRGKANASIMTNELVRFISRLRPLYDTVSGAAEFTTLEEQLRLHFSGDGKGHIELKGRCWTPPGLATLLSFIYSSTSRSLRSPFVSSKTSHPVFLSVVSNQTMKLTATALGFGYTFLMIYLQPPRNSFCSSGP